MSIFVEAHTRREACTNLICKKLSGGNTCSVSDFESIMVLTTCLCRTNLAVALANSNINGRAQYSQIHPMMCVSGDFPKDFRLPKTVESFKALDSMCEPQNIPIARILIDVVNQALPSTVYCKHISSRSTPAPLPEHTRAQAAAAAHAKLNSSFYSSIWGRSALSLLMR
jgi:hypothetical protein